MLSSDLDSAEDTAASAPIDAEGEEQEQEEEEEDSPAESDVLEEEEVDAHVNRWCVTVRKKDNRRISGSTADLWLEEKFRKHQQYKLLLYCSASSLYMFFSPLLLMLSIVFCVNGSKIILPSPSSSALTSVS